MPPITEGQSILHNNRIESAGSLAIDVRAITKRFAQDVEPALDAVSLSATVAEIHGVLGLSGAGKTTLLRCIARLETPDSGQILIAGRDWTSRTPAQLRQERGDMGVVFQQLHLLSSSTVFANVALPLELSGVARTAISSRVKELLDWFGIADKAGSHPAQLSGGQKQRVALARALATNPAVLLADEPTSALDPETRASVLKTLRRIRDQFGVTLLIITHDLHSAAEICDKITVLDRGKVAESGPARELLEFPTSEITRRLLIHNKPPEKRLANLHQAHFEEIGLA